MLAPKMTPETIAQASLARRQMKTRQMIEAMTPSPWVIAEASSSRGESQRGDRVLVAAVSFFTGRKVVFDGGFYK